jgi:hypothetical protein
VGGVRHDMLGFLFGMVSCGRASKKVFSAISTSPAVLPISIRPVMFGFDRQLMHTMSPLSCILTGYLFATKYISDLFAFPCGVRCRCARRWDWLYFIAINSALRSTRVVASNIRRGSEVCGDMRLNRRRSTGMFASPSSLVSYERQLVFDPYQHLLRPGSGALLTYIHMDLFIHWGSSCGTVDLGAGACVLVCVVMPSGLYCVGVWPGFGVCGIVCCTVVVGGVIGAVAVCAILGDFSIPCFFGCTCVFGAVV